MNFYFENLDATYAFAARVASHLSAPCVLGLNGHLGAGKTTFVRAMLGALGVEGSIKSPTFSMVETYTLPTMDIHHFDWYRMDDPRALEALGLRDYFSSHALCLIEWFERGAPYVTLCDLLFTWSSAGEYARTLTCVAMTPKGHAMIAECL